MNKYIKISFFFFIASLALLQNIFYTPIQAQEHFQKQDSIITISISAVGDLMCHSVQYKYAHVEKDSFDFAPVYRYVKNVISNSDFAFGNLETVFSGKNIKYSGYPFFNSPDDFAVPLESVGFNLLSTANNHALDGGEKGLIRTINILKNNGINYNGTFVSQRDRDSVRLFNIKGIKVAFLAYTYGTNGNPIPKKKPYCINTIQDTLIKSDILKARADGADIVLVHFHFGTEYKRLPTTYQKDVVENTIKYGADLIIGGHPHVIEPLEYFKTNNAKLDSGIIAYSLGNFISNQRWRYSDAGVILTLNISKNLRSDSVYISSVKYTPTWVFKGIIDGEKHYVILPETTNQDSIYNFLDSSNKFKMEQAFSDTKEILTKFTNRNIHLNLR